MMSPRALKQTEVQHVLANQVIVLIGDSVIRSIYKDIILHLQNSEDVLDANEIGTKGEASFRGDKLVYTNRKDGRHHREERVYQTGFFCVKYYFVTRCYDQYMEEIFQDFMDSPPDVVVFNSCLWDVTRYGDFSVNEFERRVEKLYKYLDMVLLPSCLFFWVSTLPVLTNAHNSFLLPRVHYRGHSLRLDLLEANYFVQQLCYKYERDFLDLNFHCRDLTLLHQLADGIHWNGFANRKFSNYVIRYIADCFGMVLNPVGPLLEYTPSALIEIDTHLTTSLKIPSHGSYQSSSLSPESSSDWGKKRFCNSKKNIDQPISPKTHHNYWNNSFDNISDVYKDKSECSELEHRSRSPKLNTDDEMPSLDHVAKINKLANQGCRKQRTQINYADLFDDKYPSFQAKKPTKKKQLLRKRLKGDLVDNRVKPFSKNRSRVRAIEGMSSSKSMSFSDSDSSDSGSVTSHPALDTSCNQYRSKRSSSPEEVNERETSSSNSSSSKKSRNPFFTKFI